MLRGQPRQADAFGNLRRRSIQQPAGFHPTGTERGEAIRRAIRRVEFRGFDKQRVSGAGCLSTALVQPRKTAEVIVVGSKVLG